MAQQGVKVVSVIRVLKCASVFWNAKNGLNRRWFLLPTVIWDRYLIKKEMMISIFSIPWSTGTIKHSIKAQKLSQSQNLCHLSQRNINLFHRHQVNNRANTLYTCKTNIKYILYCFSTAINISAHNRSCDKFFHNFICTTINHT